ncbi:MAG: hypothetical protein JO224_07820 [Pelomonas sp.]|nr:hypothetical protein [Burkholderiaceae bacterium]MBV8604569.1 hypothetical protein [Roseateles sp.]
MFKPKIAIHVGIMASMCLSPQAWADPNDIVLTNYTENGLRQVDFRLGSYHQNGQPSQDALILGLGYGISDSWFSEFYLGYSKSGGDAVNFDSAAIANTFLITGENSPLELGLYTEVEYERDRSQGDLLMFGPLMEFEAGLTKVNLNFLFSRNYLADFSNPMQLGYQWQVRRHIPGPVDLGLQGFGQFGQWDKFAPLNQQSHRLGPAVFGKFDVGEKNVLSYNAAVLFDAFTGVHATTFKFQAVLSF